MPVATLTCPECSTTTRLAVPIAAGKRVRCARCKAIFTVPEEDIPPADNRIRRASASDAGRDDRPTRGRYEDDEDDRPLRKPKRKKKKRGMSGGALAILIVGCVLVLAGSGVGLYFALRSGSGGGSGGSGSSDSGDKPAGVSRASLDKLEAGMTLDEVTKILGPGKEANKDDMDRAFGDAKGFGGESPSDQWFRNAKNNPGTTNWRQWRSGDDSIFVGFIKGKKSGTEIAMISFFVHRLANRGFESSSGPMAFGANDPDDTRRQRDDRIRFLNDPKWKEGKPKELIIGKWQQGSPQDSHTFGADGTVKVVSPWGNYESQYRFTDESHVEWTIPADKVPGPPGRGPQVRKYRVMVSKDELYLLQDEKGQIKLTYKRVPNAVQK